MTATNNGHISVDDVKAAARGRWRDIHAASGFNCEELDGRHHPCPKCGGTDRFRAFDDVDETGGVLCNQCFSDRNGDGLAAIQWRNDWTFGETLKAVADYLNVGSGRQHTNGHGKASKPAPATKGEPSDFRAMMDAIDPRMSAPFVAKLIAEFCASKPPITPEAVKAAGGEVVVWPKSREHGRQCVTFPAYSKPGMVSGWILRRCDGSSFTAFGGLSERKTHMLKGSSDGWVIPGGFERVAQARVVIRVEGVPDALALYPHLPADHAVITNICGAKSCPDYLDMLADKTVFVVGDADASGQAGAIKFAAKVHGIAATVKIVPMPYPVEIDHGKDVRDYFNEGHTFAELLALAEAAPIMDAPTAKEEAAPCFVIRWAGDLIDEFPEMSPAILEGLLRCGETMNIIAAPKTGKSWLSMGLGLSVVSGRKWLDRFWTRRGKVLIVDNELNPRTSADRLPRIAEAMGIQRDEYARRLGVANVRGQLIDLNALAVQLGSLESGAFDLIILDAWYRFQPTGSDENSNGDVTQLYNLLDSVANKLGSAFVCIHHTSKGNQSGKGVTDVGSGAGAQSRAPDSHLTMRLHEEDNAVVVEAAVRSFAPMEPFCLRWNFPVWTPADDLDPKDLRQERPRKKSQEDAGPSPAESRDQKERTARLKVFESYEATPTGNTESKLSAAAGMNSRTFAPIQADLLRKGLAVACKVKKNNGASYDGFTLSETGLAELRQLRQLRQNEGVSDLSDTTPTAALSLESGVSRSVVSEPSRELSDIEMESGSNLFPVGAA